MPTPTRPRRPIPGSPSLFATAADLPPEPAEVAAPTGAQVAAALGRYRFRWQSEDDLQAALAAVLTREGMAAKREVRLTARDRLDLLVGRVGLEVKVVKPGSAAPIERVLEQLRRYADSDQLDELVLVSTSIRHRHTPDTVGGKPLHTVIVGGRLQ